MKRGLWCVLESCSFSAVGDCNSSFVGSEWPMLECDVNGVGGECSWFNLLWLCPSFLPRQCLQNCFWTLCNQTGCTSVSSFASITHHLSVTFHSDTWTTAEASCVIVCQWSLTSRIGGWVGRGVAPGAQWYVLVFVLPKLWQPWSTGQDCRK